MDSNSSAYLAGRLIGTFALLPLVAVAIGYAFMRIKSGHALTKEQKGKLVRVAIIAFAICVVLAVMRAAMNRG